MLTIPRTLLKCSTRASAEQSKSQPNNKYQSKTANATMARVPSTKLGQGASKLTSGIVGIMIRTQTIIPTGVLRRLFAGYSRSEVRSG